MNNCHITNIDQLSFESITGNKNRTTSQLSHLILHSVLSANKANFQAQLKLALAWNRIDVAESEIFTEDTKREKFRVSVF